MGRGSRRLLLVGLVALIVLLGVATLSTRPAVRVPDELPTWSAPAPSVSESTEPSADASNPVDQPAGKSPLNRVVALLLVAIGLTAIGVALWSLRGVIAALLRFRWGRYRRSAAQPPTDAVDPPPPEDATEEIGEAVAAGALRQREALSADDPRTGVIACWVELERSVTAVGLRPLPSETSSELTLRALGRLELPGEGVHRLAELYREARFSQHDITEEHRASAQSALQEVHAQIGQRRVGTT